tara:strand:- start:780 stop:1097 length:318 start_codon:yes stop_codon:yes gene_type:complete
MKEKTIEKGAGFTQGPWTSEDCTPGESTGLCYAIKSEHTIVARTTDGWKEAQANARLIAQAPAMYQQCKLFEKMLVELQMQGETGVDEQLENVRELLASVEGGEV